MAQLNPEQAAIEVGRSPINHTIEDRGWRNNGLTKREWLAGLAMQGLCSNPAIDFESVSSVTVAAWAVDQADELLLAIAKEPTCSTPTPSGSE